MRPVIAGCEYSGTSTVDETVAEFEANIEPHLTEADRSRILLQRNWWERGPGWSVSPDAYCHARHLFAIGIRRSLPKFRGVILIPGAA